MSSSLAQLSATLYVLLEAVSLLYLGSHLVMQVLGPGWIIPFWFKIKKWGGGL